MTKARAGTTYRSARPRGVKVRQADLPHFYDRETWRSVSRASARRAAGRWDGTSKFGTK